MRFRRFLPRLPEQPFSYPVTNQDDATQIARDWNVKDEASGRTGSLLRFCVQTGFLQKYPVQTVGSAVHQEYWIPALQLEKFNNRIDGLVSGITQACKLRNDKVSLSKQIHIVIPTGTKVLTRTGGRVGIVIHAFAAPEHGYRVRFADGEEESYRRSELTIFKHADSEIPGGSTAGDLQRFVIFRCIVGSTAYGLNHEGSDVDRRGIYLPPAELHWALAGVPEQLETDHEECYWEIEKFIRLGLKANPNILECLYSPLVETCTPLAAELIEMRHIFLSRHIHRTYNSYVLSQFKKLEQDLRNEHGVRWKHVMHLIRLLLSGVAVLKDGFVPLRVDKHRDQLLAIRRGEVPWSTVEEWRLRLHRELDQTLETTRLPEHPDYERANQFLLQARRHAASKEYGVR